MGSPRSLSPRPPRRRARWKRAVTVFVGMVILLIVTVFLWARASLLPPPKGLSVTVLISPGASASGVATKLRQLGLIKSAFWFRLYLRQTGQGEHIQAGRYQIRPGETVSEISAQLIGGDVADASVRVTIPEGFTVSQIADALANAHICSASAFLHAEEHAALTQPWLAQVSKQPDVKHRLEGYLFPDTYAFYPGEPVHEVLNEFLTNFTKHIQPLSRAMRQKHITLSTLVTVASLIEREAKVESERPLIASVIYNRLQAGRRLQIDASIEYILGHTPVVTDADTRIQDPYNTYVHAGLPPGPIANPGMASILAALQPQHTNYFYYVVRNDGSGRDYFATTYAQQLVNMARSEANLNHVTQQSSLITP